MADEATTPDVAVDVTSPEFIDSIVKEFTAQAVEEINPQGQEETKPVEAGSPDPGPVEHEAAPDTSEPPPPLVSPELAALSRRERELRAKQEQWEAAKQAEIEAAKNAIIQELIKNPRGFAERYKLERAADIGMGFYAAELGEDLPSEMKQQMFGSEIERKLYEQEQKINNFSQMIQSQLAEVEDRKVLASYQGFLQSVPDTLPYLAKDVAADPDDTLRAMAEIGDYVAQTEGRYPTPQECAALLERQISSMLARYGATQPQTPAPETVIAEKSSDEITLSNKLSDKSTDVTPLGEDECFDDALKYLKEHL